MSSISCFGEIDVISIAMKLKVLACFESNACVHTKEKDNNLQKVASLSIK
jgi:hypothetical protein